MKRSILIIGGCGFIGSVLRRRLSEAGHDVTVFDKYAPLAMFDRFIRGDIRDPLALTEALRGRELVVNLAAEHHDDVRPASLYRDVNVRGAQILCAAAAATGVPRILFTSSVAVYGRTIAVPSEASPMRPDSLYGSSKLEAEHIYRAWQAQAPDRRLTIVRPCVVFGPGNRGNIYQLLHRIKKKQFVMFGDGAVRRSIAYVENVTAFIEHVLRTDLNYDTFNYADSPDLTLKEIVDIAHAALGRKPARTRFPRWTGRALGVAADAVSALTGREMPIRSAQIERFFVDAVIDARRAGSIGFTPPRPLPEVIKEMITRYV